MPPPTFPVGPFEPSRPDAAARDSLIVELARTPSVFADVVRSLTDAQLDTRYVNWSARTIVHHVADSHLNCYVRFKWALTEDTPTIKPYDETAWAALPDTGADVSLGLNLLAAVHAKWDALLRAMDDAAFARPFHHPESGETLPLAEVLPLYTWHTRHHAGQIAWLRREHGW